MIHKGFIPALGVAACLGLAAPVFGEGDAHWSYGGAEGPLHWGELSEKFATCKTGQNQSPVNIISGEAVKADLKPIEFAYKTIPLSVQNNGHTIYVPTPGAGGISVDGRTYDLVQFHFHSPSEHQIDGKAGDLVVHLVHKDSEGHLAVVGVLMNKGETAHPLLEKLWSVLPKEKGDLQKTELEIDPAAFLPQDRNYYTYTGSLTTPPCSEDVKWLVLKQAVAVSAAQVEQYASLYPHSVRPVQPLNARAVSSSN